MPTTHVRSGVWEKHTVFRYFARDNDGTGNIFETDQAETDTPTLYLSTFRYPENLVMGMAYRIHYELEPTNAVTYTLRLYCNSIANDIWSRSEKLYESPAGQADSIEYDREVKIPFKLINPGRIWYTIDWSAAPGNTPGFIEVTGVVEH